MRYSISLLFIFMSLTPANAVSLGETSSADTSMTPRTVLFNRGPDSSRASVGLCQTGIWEARLDSGKRVADFMSPCVFGSYKMENGDSVTGQLGLGLVRVLDTLSFNLAIDSDKGSVYTGVGIELTFDSAFTDLMG